MLNLLLAAGPDPMASMMASPSFKNFLTIALVVIAGLALFAPTLLQNAKSIVIGWVKTDLNLAATAVSTAAPAAAPVVTIANTDIQALLTQLQAMQAQPVQAPATTGTVTVAQTPVSVDNVVQDRAAALKNACPQSTAEQRLYWLEQGFDPSKAQVDYIALLEKQLTALNTAPAIASSTPATPPPPTGK